MQVASTVTSFVSLTWSLTIAFSINQNALIFILLFLGQILMIGDRN